MAGPSVTDGKKHATYGNWPCWINIYRIVDFLKNGWKPPFQLMEDSAPAHGAVATRQWHVWHGIKLFPGWPGNSGDLNQVMISDEEYAER